MNVILKRVVLALGLSLVSAIAQADSFIMELEAMKTRISALEEANKARCPGRQSIEIDGLCVFHINLDGYNFDHGGATAMCAALGASLCTMNQMALAQEKGAQWCSNGWTKDLQARADVFDQVGSFAYPMQEASGSCGGKADLIVTPNRHVSMNAGANCCMQIEPN